MNKKSFTLIELLVVIAIIGILSSLVIARFSNWNDNARIANTLQWSAGVHRKLGANLVGYWNFEGDIKDISGNNKPASWGGGGSPTYVDGSVSGRQALSLNATGNYVGIGTGNNYFPLSEITICTWVKSPGLASGMDANGIMSITYGLTIRLESTGVFAALVDNGESLSFFIASSNNLHDNKYHHLCLSLDGSVAKMYTDGVSKITMDDIAWLGTTRWPTNIAVIGHDQNNPSTRRFNGEIDEVIVYGSFLTAEEISRIYAETKDSYLAYE